MNWQKGWITIAGLLVIAAGVFLWRNNLSAAFVIAALGACAWFLSYRAEIRSKFPDDDENDDEAGESAAEADPQSDHETDET